MNVPGSKRCICFLMMSQFLLHQALLEYEPVIAYVCIVAQVDALANVPGIIVATPGRLLEMATENLVSLGRSVYILTLHLATWLLSCLSLATSQGCFPSRECGDR